MVVFGSRVDVPLKNTPVFAEHQQVNYFWRCSVTRSNEDACFEHMFSMALGWNSMSKGSMCYKKAKQLSLRVLGDLSDVEKSVSLAVLHNFPFCIARKTTSCKHKNFFFCNIWMFLQNGYVYIGYIFLFAIPIWAISRVMERHPQ